jgi:hypothetical protein
MVSDTVALSPVWANKPYANGNGVNVDCFILYVVPESSTAYSAVEVVAVNSGNPDIGKFGIFFYFINSL